jgi:hypothetical protein
MTTTSVAEPASYPASAPDMAGSSGMSPARGAAAMTDAAINDVSRVLSFGREKLARKNMIFAAIAGAFGVLAVLVAGDDTMMTVVGWGLTAFGLGFFGWELSKVTQKQKPLLVLTPEALFIRLEGATEFAIPWSEVRGVDRIDIEGLRGAVFEGVTVVLVDRVFYDRVIHVDSFIRRGPGWDQFFVPLGDDRMQVALHHAFLPVEPDELLAAVEARYKAFGTAPPA